MQKLIGDYNRYAFEAATIERYVEPEVEIDPENPSPVKIRDKDDPNKTVGTSSVENTNDDQSIEG